MVDPAVTPEVHLTPLEQAAMTYARAKQDLDEAMATATLPEAYEGAVGAWRAALVALDAEALKVAAAKAKEAAA